jgi:DNA polymerase III subunit chi
MTDLRFYHLRRDTADRAVPDLVIKALAHGHKILIKLPDTARRQHYDDWLWRFKPDSFIPHAQDGDPQPEMQPVWLSTSDEAPNDASMALVVEGAKLPPLENFKLVCLVFSSENTEELEQSRGLWRELKNNKNLRMTYWQQQENGAWTQANA